MLSKKSTASIQFDVVCVALEAMMRATKNACIILTAIVAVNFGTIIAVCYGSMALSRNLDKIL